MYFCLAASMCFLFKQRSASEGRMRVWRSDVCSSDLPVVCFAAYGRVPVVQLGDAFTLPPSEGETVPGFQPKKRATVPAEQIVAVMNAVQARLGGPPVPSVTAPLRTAEIGRAHV